MSPDLWSQTPLIYSSDLSEITGTSVYLKLENLQPSYSFKYRGISHFVQRAKEIHGPDVHLVTASGGNAGIAAAFAARSLGLKCSIFIPEWVSSSTLALLKRQNAEVVVGGRIYAEALAAAESLVLQEPKAVMVPAYDDPIVWEGHSSMISEIQEQLPVKPDAIFCSVGGAGLLGGVITGCKRVGWDDVTIGTVGTNGSDSFYESIALNPGRFNHPDQHLAESISLVHNAEEDVYLAHFSEFKSKASGSLGASEPSARVVKMALSRQGKVINMSVPDGISMEALLSFADHHKFLVELACATALVPAYSPALVHKILENTPRMNKEQAPVLVFIVCGGFKIDLATASEYQQYLATTKESNKEGWEIKWDDGELIQVPFTRLV